MVSELSPKKLIESGALEQVQLQQDNTQTALLSIAISLKRLADVMTTPEGGFNYGWNFAAGVEQVAFNIGQQIDRGIRAG